jgi:glycosyltransferase EpsF
MSIMVKKQEPIVKKYKHTTKYTRNILMVLTSININGGVQNKIMDIYRNIDRDKVQFDFCILSSTNDTFESEINSLGGNVFYFGIPREIGTISFLRKFYQLIKYKDYHVVHSYLDVNDGVILFLARLAGIKIRISHSRGAHIDEGYKKKVFPILKQLIILNSTKLLASSEQAGNFLYKRKQFEVIPNGLNFDKFLAIDQEKVNQLKIKIDIKQDTLVLGHIGRFSVEKNHEFLLSIAEILKLRGINFKMILVGDGELRNTIEEKVNILNMQNYFYFAGSQTNVELFYQIFDIFLFPSFHEGFGNVAVEAQAANNLVLASNVVSKEVDLGLGLIKFISLDDINSWISFIANYHRQNNSVSSTDDIRKALDSKGFAIDCIIEKYYKVYEI